MGRINFDLQELQAFVAVAERSSFRAAAEDLHLSQPALSRRVEKLEHTLGARLLASPWFVRQVVLDRWFLHANEPALRRRRLDGARRAAGRRVMW